MAGEPLNTTYLTRIEECMRQSLEIDNSQRNEAEIYLNQMLEDPNSFISNMLGIIRHSTLTRVRSLACVLLRQKLNLKENGIYRKLSEDMQKRVKSELLKHLEVEKYMLISERVCEVIGLLGKELLKENEWPELIPCVFSLTTSNEPSIKQAGILLIHFLAQYFTTAGRADLENLLRIFRLNLKDRDQGSIQVQTIRCLSSILCELHGADIIPFISLIPPILKTLGDLLNKSLYSMAQESIRALTCIADVHPNFFKQNLESIISAMISIARTSNVELTTRHLALDFLAVMIEQAPVMIRSLPTTTFTIPVLSVLFSMLLDVDDDENWINEDTEPESDTSIECILDLLRRISICLGSKRLLPKFFEIVEEYMGSDDWKHRYAAINAMTQITESIKQDDERRKITQYVIHVFGDSHPRVRFASVRCFGQLATDFQPLVQNEMTAESLNALFSLLNPSHPVRIRFITTAAMANFVDGASDQVLSPVLRDMIQALIQPLRYSPCIVQQQIISTIAGIADSVKDQFSVYYNEVMPLIKSLYITPPEALSDMQASDALSYRANALECISLIGMAVGGEMFQQDARDVLQAMYEEGMCALDGHGDGMRTHMMLAWGRMCSSLKQDFLPYLDVMMPILLKAANASVPLPDESDSEESDYEINFHFIDDDTVSEASMSDSDDESVYDSLHECDSELYEKVAACKVLAMFVDELQENIVGYLHPITVTLYSLLNQTSMSEILLPALSCMPVALKAVKKSIVNESDSIRYREAMVATMESLLTFLMNETRIQMLIHAVQTLHLCLEQTVIVVPTSSDPQQQQQQQQQQTSSHVPLSPPLAAASILGVNVSDPSSVMVTSSLSSSQPPPPPPSSSSSSISSSSISSSSIPSSVPVLSSSVPPPIGVSIPSSSSNTTITPSSSINTGMMTNVAVLRPKEIEKIVEVIQKLLESSFTTRSTRITESLLSADFIDDLQVEKYMEMESNENKLHFLLMECLGSLVHHYSVITLPLMDTYLLPQIMECSDESRTIGDRRMAVVLMMRVIEYGDRLVFKYYPSFIPVFLREMKSSDSELRDVAVNGIGYAAEKGQDLICEVVAASVTEIERLVEDEFSSTEAFYSVNANAIISLGKLCVYVGHYLIRLRDHVQFFLCRLPLNCNHNHTSYRWWSYVSRETHCDVLQILCLIYERYARDVVEECNQVILPILQYFCDSIDNPSLDISMSLKTRILRTLLKIQCQLPSSIMNALWEYLGSEKTRNIQAYCVRFM